MGNRGREKTLVSAGLQNGRSVSGFSLVELMVGVAVGLIGIMAIMEAYRSNEAIKRSTGGVGMSQANGAVAMHMLTRDIRMGGYGFIQKDALNCSGLASIQWSYNGQYSSTAGGGTLPAIVLAPVRIQDGMPTGVPDTITVTSGTDEKALISNTVGIAPPAGQILVAANYGFDTNDMFLIAQPGSCAMYNVTAPQAGDTASMIRIATGPLGPFNPPNPAAYTPYIANTSAVMNLGQLTVNRYDVVNSDLRVTPMFTNIGVAGQLPTLSNVPQIVGNDIVDLKAYYGKDTSQNFSTPPSISPGAALNLTWNKTVPTTADQWSQVRVIKLALLARSGNYEKPDASGTCNATKAGDVSLKFSNPALSSVANNDAFNVIPGGLPSCYRYRAFETIIPLRNLIWRN
jgi:type IV pilus assembly protein PilW